jgi:hypothetical protein
MHLLKLIGLALTKLVKQAWLLPQTLALSRQQRQQQLARDEFELDRLDRLRNPSKYQGR